MQMSCERIPDATARGACYQEANKWYGDAINALNKSRDAGLEHRWNDAKAWRDILLELLKQAESKIDPLVRQQLGLPPDNAPNRMMNSILLSVDQAPATETPCGSGGVGGLFSGTPTGSKCFSLSTAGSFGRPPSAPNSITAIANISLSASFVTGMSMWDEDTGEILTPIMSMQINCTVDGEVVATMKLAPGDLSVNRIKTLNGDGRLRARLRLRMTDPAWASVIDNELILDTQVHKTTTGYVVGSSGGPGPAWKLFPLCNWMTSDFNRDQALNTADISAFMTAIAAQDPITDVNTDGVWNQTDIDTFIEHFDQDLARQNTQ